MRRTCLAVSMMAANWPGFAATDRLTEPVIAALAAAKNDATVRADWIALAAEYSPTAQIVGLYYDRAGMPHVHDGPAGTDMAATAALRTKRTDYAATQAISRMFISPDGQRATVNLAVTADYQAGGKHIHRVFDETLIVQQAGGQPRIAQDISVERPPA